MGATARHFKPKFGGRFGTHPVFVNGTVAATSSATVNTLVGIPKRLVFLEKATVTLSTLGVSASGTILLKVQVIATDGSTARDINSTALSLESNGVATALVPVDITITAAEKDRFIKAGETIRLNVVSNNTNGTAPVGFVSFELLVQE